MMRDDNRPIYKSVVNPATSDIINSYILNPDWLPELYEDIFLHRDKCRGKQ